MEVVGNDKAVAPLLDFYTILKASDAYLKWVFLTGVSKFSRVSIFSGLNNLQEVTQDESGAILLGITQTELEENFAEQLTALQTKLQMNRPHLLAEIERWYNGYSWDGVQKVYNPFSLLNLFAKLKFSNMKFEWHVAPEKLMCSDTLICPKRFNIEKHSLRTRKHYETSGFGTETSFCGNTTWTR